MLSSSSCQQLGTVDMIPRWCEIGSASPRDAQNVISLVVAVRSTSMRVTSTDPVRFIAFIALAFTSATAVGQTVQVDSSKMQRMGTVDERFQSYNVEMLEVTGGKFWKPYSSLERQAAAQPASSGGPTPSGMDPNLYEY